MKAYLITGNGARPVALGVSLSDDDINRMKQGVPMIIAGKSIFSNIDLCIQIANTEMEINDQIEWLDDLANKQKDGD